MGQHFFAPAHATSLVAVNAEAKHSLSSLTCCKNGYQQVLPCYMTTTAHRKSFAGETFRNFAPAKHSTAQLNICPEN